MIPNNPEELRLIIEPFPFLSSEEKDKIIDSATKMYEFNTYINKKYNNVSEEIPARLQLQLAAKMSEKHVKYNPENFDGETTPHEVIFGEAWNDIAISEGYEIDLTEAAQTIVSLETTIDTNIQKMIDDGREEELEKFLDMMEKIEKK